MDRRLICGSGRRTSGPFHDVDRRWEVEVLQVVQEHDRLCLLEELLRLGAIHLLIKHRMNCQRMCRDDRDPRTSLQP